MRIIGQCNRVDFASIEHLADITEKPEAFDVNTLTDRQRFAFMFLTVALRSSISWNLMRKVVKGVLFWGEGDEKVKGVTIKFVQDTKLRADAEEFRSLWVKGGVYAART